MKTITEYKHNNTRIILRKGHIVLVSDKEE